MSKNKSKLILDPIYRFIYDESFSGILLIISAVIALLWANSHLGDSYFNLWEKTYFTIALNDYALSKPLYYWINDGLMAIFFFIIGLEIKRELIFGSLNTRKKAILPVFAALGGMLIPALIFFSFTFKDSELSNGWAIPMATDIAFSLGILALLGKRVPVELKIFLTALAIVDDLGAVLSIAIFYTGELNFTYLMIAGVVFVGMLILNHLGIRNIWIYAFAGIFGLWLMLLLSGVHATIAGVATALLIPTGRKLNTSEFRDKMQRELQILSLAKNQQHYKLLDEKQMSSIERMKIYCTKVESPLQRLEHNLHYFSIFLIMPLFALANTGVIISSNVQLFDNPISYGIIFGLMFGKPLGILLFSLLAVKLKLASLPMGINLKHLIGVGFLAGIAFTMSLFITDLAFHGFELSKIAKISIFIGSILSGIIGYVILRNIPKQKGY